MTKFATFAAALGLTASSALAGGYVAPVVEVEPVVVDAAEPASSNAGLVVPALVLLGVIAAVASDDDDDDDDDSTN